MPTRKKGGKSLHKKQQQIVSKTEAGYLSDTLFRRIEKELSLPSHSNVNVSLLESLLTEDEQQLKSILQSQSDSLGKIKQIVNNIVESKVDLLVSKILGLMQRESSRDYLYPWLLQLHRAYPHRFGQQTVSQLLQITEGREEPIDLLLRVEGKFQLIHF